MEYGPAIPAGEDRSSGMVAGVALAGRGGVVYRTEGHGGACEFNYPVPLLRGNRYAARCPEGLSVGHTGGPMLRRVARSGFVGGYGYPTGVRFVAARARQAGRPALTARRGRARRGRRGEQAAALPRHD